MFTGIVEETGRIERLEKHSGGARLFVRARKCGGGVRKGESIAVNGCCLTVTGIRVSGKTKILKFDLLEETLKRTDLGDLAEGSLVNLERAMPANGRFGGHFVTGHIDGVGRIAAWEKRGNDFYLEVEAGRELLRYVVLKGSIAIDGISLTVAGVRKKSFAVWIIPHTRGVTNLQQRKVGDRVNLETDLIGKYLERLSGKGIGALSRT